MDNNFGSDIEWFVKHIESRKSMLPTFAHASGELTSKVSKDIDKFVEEHAYDKKFDDDGELTEFAVPQEYSSRYGLLNRTYQNSLIFTDLLPKMTLVSLVSLFDAYLARLIRTLFDVKPDILNGSNKQLTFSELVELGGLQEAKEHIVNLEVESVLRCSHAEQFDWLESKIGIPLRKDLSIWKDFVELTERRNLFVHADGIVSKSYLSVCKRVGFNHDYQVDIGDRLDVAPEYYEKACDCVMEIGIKLGQVMWRKLLPKDTAAADASLIDVTYNLLFRREYSQALVMSEFSNIPAIKNHSLEYAYYLKINHAIALKGLEKKEKCNETIDEIDWSALSDKFKLAAAVLKEDYEEAVSLMKRIGKDGDIEKAQYRTWPLFRWFRRTDEFKSAYKEIFGEEYKILSSVSPDSDREEAEGSRVDEEAACNTSRTESV